MVSVTGSIVPGTVTTVVSGTIVTTVDVTTVVLPIELVMVWVSTSVT
jgi:hypothetical protein